MKDKIIALDLAPAELSEATKAYFAKCEEKLGLVPNVLLAYAFDETKLRAFTDIPRDGAVRCGPTGSYISYCAFSLRLCRFGPMIAPAA